MWRDEALHSPFALMDEKKALVQLAQGVYVERDVARIAEKIQEYDSNLRLQYVDPAVSEIHDAPYCLVEICRDGMRRIVFYIWELDDRVLERLYAADTRRHDVLAQVDNKNEQVRRDLVRRYQDRMEQAADMARHVLASHKSKYTIRDEEQGGRLIEIKE